MNPETNNIHAIIHLVSYVKNLTGTNVTYSSNLHILEYHLALWT